MADPFSKAAAFRAASDTDDIVNLAIRKTRFVGARARVQLSKDIRSGKPINVVHTIVKGLQPTLAQTLVISHLLGIRRFWLMRNKINDLKLPPVALSTLADAVAVLRHAANIDLNQLQKQYQTQALKIGFGVADHAQKQLHNTVADLVESGAHRAQAIQTLGAKMNSLGLTDASDFQLETIFRTQSSIAYQAGKYQAEQDPDIQDILWGYKYVTVGDDRVRESHAVLEGTTLPKTDPFWTRFYPPNGWNCRCQAIPIFEKRTPVHPPREDNNGRPIAPDKGFNFNPGIVFGQPVDTSDDDVAPIKPPSKKKVEPPVEDKKVEPPIPPIEEKKVEPPVVSLPKPATVRGQVKQLFDTEHKPLFQGIAKVIKDSDTAKFDKEATDAKAELDKLQKDALAVQAAAEALVKLYRDQTDKKSEQANVLIKQYYEFDKQLQDLNDRMQSTFDRIVAAAHKVKEAKEKQRDEIFKILQVKSPVTLTLTEQSTNSHNVITKKYKDRLADPSVEVEKRKIATQKTQKAIDIVGKITDKSIIGAKSAEVGTYLLQDGRRPFAEYRSVFCEADEGIETFAHELGHVLEDYGDTTDTIRKWIDERAKGEQLTNLQTKFGGDYQHSEEGVADDWLKLTRAMKKPDAHAYYIGKSYKDSAGKYYATEVLSMGIQYMYEDAATFAKTDPEYFSFVLGILRGEIK